jgi:hypothetical protein
VDNLGTSCGEPPLVRVSTPGDRHRWTTHWHERTRHPQRLGTRAAHAGVKAFITTSNEELGVHSGPSTQSHTKVTSGTSRAATSAPAPNCDQCENRSAEGKSAADSTLDAQVYRVAPPNGPPNKLKQTRADSAPRPPLQRPAPTSARRGQGHQERTPETPAHRGGASQPTAPAPTSQKIPSSSHTGCTKPGTVCGQLRWISRRSACPRPRGRSRRPGRRASRAGG